LVGVLNPCTRAVAQRVPCIQKGINPFSIAALCPLPFFDKAFGKSLEHYKNAGERLAKVRDDFRGIKKVKGSGFATWVENNCNCEKTKAYRYIAVWENWNEIVALMQQSGEVFTLVDALKAIKDIKQITIREIQKIKCSTLLPRITYCALEFCH